MAEDSGKDTNRPEDGHNRKRVTQTTKRALQDKSFEAVRSDRLRHVPAGLESRRMPKARDRQDAVLAAVSLALGFGCIVFLLLFFAGIWPDAGYAVMGCFAGILCVGGIDSMRDSRWKAALMFAGAVLLIAAAVVLKMM